MPLCVKSDVECRQSLKVPLTLKTGRLVQDLAVARDQNAQVESQISAITIKHRALEGVNVEVRAELDSARKRIVELESTSGTSDDARRMSL